MNFCENFNKFFISFVEKIEILIGSDFVQKNASKTIKKLSMFCFILFFAILIWFGFVFACVVLPFELRNLTFSQFIFNNFCYFYSSFLVLFFYFKTKSTLPTRRAGKIGDKFCYRCHFWKGPETHHCSICDRCIFKLDHHCPWFDTCVGAHNQPYFFLYLFHIFLGISIFFVLSSKFWMQHFQILFRSMNCEKTTKMIWESFETCDRHTIFHITTISLGLLGFVQFFVFLILAQYCLMITKETTILKKLFCSIIFTICALIVTYTVFFLIIPHEIKVAKSQLFLLVRLLLWVWIFWIVFFHYFKARSLRPFKIQGFPGDDFCIRCNNWKSSNTTHCIACDRCVYLMDHHCVHIGQCVGAHNQLNFFGFLLNLYIGTLLFYGLATDFWTQFLLIKIEKIGEKCQNVEMCSSTIFEHIFMIKNVDQVILVLSISLSIFLNILMLAFLCGYSFAISTGAARFFIGINPSDAQKLTTMSSWNKIRWRWRTFFGLDQNQSIFNAFFNPFSKKSQSFLNRKY